jgi:D-alanyl-D-alanine carboxypeptidase
MSPRWPFSRRARFTIITIAKKPTQDLTSKPAEDVVAIAKKRTQDIASYPGPFHIQIGAFPDATQAEERLNLVKQALGPALLQKHPPFVMAVHLPTGVWIYRARLSQFDETQAKVVCKELHQKGLECWDIRSD